MSTRKLDTDATVARGSDSAMALGNGDATAAAGGDGTATRGGDATVALGGDQGTRRQGHPAPGDTLTAAARGAGGGRASDAGTTAEGPSLPGHGSAGGVGLVRGYRLRERYVLDGLIGQGAMGQVWRAKDLLGEEAKDRNPFVAVKVLIGDVEAHPDAFVALHREAARAQKLAHPNIITVYVFDRDDRARRAFIAMELLEGQPLDRVIREAGVGLPRRKALPIIRGMAEGLAYAHRMGLVHSDFKPANVFLTGVGVPKILDFGIARAVKSLDGGERAAALDDSGFQGYTAAYAPPEVLAGASDPSTADDVFALGLVAYELLTGRHPFDRRDALKAEAGKMHPPPLRGLPRREARAIERAVAFERHRRHRDAGVFLRELQGVPVIQKVLVAAVATLVLAAGGLWYAKYLDSLPAQPLEQLSEKDQRDFRANVAAGNESLAFMKSAHYIPASADAADLFAAAYRIHPKDPQAVEGLNKAADSAIEWYRQMPDRAQALEELKKFRAKSEYYKNYAPLVRAIVNAGGDVTPR
jgi:serine/threonine protein kinase